MAIQNTIDARMAVASSATHPSNSSCIFCGNSAPPTSSAIPSAAQSSGGKHDTEPYRRQRVLAAGLLEITRNDANDQRRLDALAEHDQERDEQ